MQRAIEFGWERERKDRKRKHIMRMMIKTLEIAWGKLCKREMGLAER